MKKKKLSQEEFNMCEDIYNNKCSNLEDKNTILVLFLIVAIGLIIILYF